MKMFNALGDRLLGLVLPTATVSAASALACWDTGVSCGVSKTRYCCDSGNCYCVCHC
ncbi:hypothetical protein [Actinoplanes derwentensis]|uniref:Uncharacterized protein n=1 Tax=Actinoplanes derwentensis TaxID=113562 RepID=A0A1H1R4W3_9ACTN|nr:hypothetical protein [Actinoplanes derwentensis]SDS29959.1 hypothetical protein SAMN04489716_0477 [Actinoplanes derwentensis]